jgi:hypothetical protein
MQITITAVLAETFSPAVVPVHTVSWPRGADGKLRVQVVSDAGEPVNLAGRSVSVALPFGARAATVTDALNGWCEVGIAAVDTDGYTPGSYPFDVWLDDVDGRVPIVRPSSFVVLAAVLSSSDDPGASTPIGTGVIGAVDTMADLAAVDASGLTDGFALWVRGTDGGARGYYHVEIGSGLVEDGVAALAALNLTGGQWVRGLG